MTESDWNGIVNPMMPDWPKVPWTVATLEYDRAGTRLRLTWSAHEASASEIARFAGAMAGLDQGWGKGMEVLADLLAALQS